MESVYYLSKQQTHLDNNRNAAGAIDGRLTQLKNCEAQIL